MNNLGPIASERDSEKAELERLARSAKGWEDTARLHLINAKDWEHKSDTLQDLVRKLTSAARKVLSAFPDTIPQGEETVTFSIPGYAVEDLRSGIEDAEEFLSK